jgi:hypothetical protein
MEVEVVVNKLKEFKRKVFKRSTKWEDLYDKKRKESLKWECKYNTLCRQLNSIMDNNPC